MTFKIGDMVEVETRFHGAKPGIIIDIVEDASGSSWEVLHILEHWTPTTIAFEQDLKMIQVGTCNPAAAVV
tara:strand:- start:556 stop:768 length:213 start_codon:yes stop_codon:yes gene_type:complete